MSSFLTSSIKGINWPALPEAQSVGRLATLFQLEQSQWWSAEKLLQHQFLQLTTLLEHAISNVPYYSSLLDKTLLSSPLNQQSWLTIPLLTRDKLQKAGPSINAVKMPDHGGVAPARTSGSTGKPVEILRTPICDHFWNVFTLRDHIWHQRNLSGKLAVIRYSQSPAANSNDGQTSTNWGPATHGLYNTGPCILINIHTPITQLIDWIEKTKPDYLLTHPSVVQELALHCEKYSVSFSSLCEIRTISESLPGGLRELCKKVWGIPLIDLYSTIELGYLALQCPQNDHYHVQSEGILLEVLDDNNQPCTPGQVGKVVVTNLHNFATPLIRYEVGDYAEVGDVCDCGRGLPVIKRIYGRYRNLVTLPNGEKSWPKFGMKKILEIAPVLQYQGIQHSLREIEYLLVMERPLTNAERKQLELLFIDYLFPSMKITITEVETISRSKNGKYEEFISLI